MIETTPHYRGSHTCYGCGEEHTLHGYGGNSIATVKLGSTAFNVCLSERGGGVKKSCYMKALAAEQACIGCGKRMEGNARPYIPQLCPACDRHLAAGQDREAVVAAGADVLVPVVMGEDFVPHRIKYPDPNSCSSRIKGIEGHAASPHWLPFLLHTIASQRPGEHAHFAGPATDANRIGITRSAYSRNVAAMLAPHQVAALRIIHQELADLAVGIEAAVDSAYTKGKREGADILRGLADGTVGAETFNDTRTAKRD